MSSFEETKSLIRSLLVSTQKSLTIEQLDRDFKQTEGRPIPYHEFGFHSLKEMLQSITDTVQLISAQDRFGRHVYHVQLVVSQKSAHVDKLVMRQRSNPRMTGAVRRTALPPRQRPQAFAPRSYSQSPIRSLMDSGSRVSDRASYGHGFSDKSTPQNRTRAPVIREVRDQPLQSYRNERSAGGERDRVLETSAVRQLRDNRTLAPSVREVDKMPPQKNQETSYNSSTYQGSYYKEKESSALSSSPRKSRWDAFPKGYKQRSRSEDSNTSGNSSRDRGSTTRHNTDRGSHNATVEMDIESDIASISSRDRNPTPQHCTQVESRTVTTLGDQVAQFSQHRKVDPCWTDTYMPRPVLAMHAMNHAAAAPTSAASLPLSSPPEGGQIPATQNTEPSLYSAGNACSKRSSVHLENPSSKIQTKKVETKLNPFTASFNPSLSSVHFPQKENYNNLQTAPLMPPPTLGQPIQYYPFVSQNNYPYPPPLLNFPLYPATPFNFYDVGAGYLNQLLSPFNQNVPYNSQVNTIKKAPRAVTIEKPTPNQAPSAKKETFKKVSSNIDKTERDRDQKMTDKSVNNTETEVCKKLEAISLTMSQEVESQETHDTVQSTKPQNFFKDVYNTTLISQNVEFQNQETCKEVDNLSISMSKHMELQDSNPIDYKYVHTNVSSLRSEHTGSVNTPQKDNNFGKYENIEVLKKKKERMLATKLEEDSKARFHSELERKSMGHNSTIDRVTCPPNLYSGYHPNHQSEIVLQPVEQPSQSSDKSVRTVESNYVKSAQQRVPNLILNRISVLLKKHPEGISDTLFSKIYLSEYGEHLNARAYGFDSLLKLLSFLSWCVELKLEDGEVKVIAKYKAECPPSVALPMLDHSFIYEPLNAQIPADVMKINEDLPPFIFPSNLKVGSETYIKCGEIYNPSKFYMYLQLREYGLALDALMDDMQIAYALNIQHLKVKHPYRGLYVACTYEREWHRGKIINISSNVCEVLYVDYGTKNTKTLDEIYYLNKSMAYLPPQAFLGSLHNVIPKDKKNDWPRAASQKFLTLINEADVLIAMITSINQEEKTLVVCLVNTQKEQDVHINDTLIQTGFADYIFSPKNSNQMLVTLKQEIVEDHGVLVKVPTTINSAFSGASGSQNMALMDNTAQQQQQQQQQPSISNTPDAEKAVALIESVYENFGGQLAYDAFIKVMHKKYESGSSTSPMSGHNMLANTHSPNKRSSVSPSQILDNYIRSPELENSGPRNSPAAISEQSTTSQTLEMHKQDEIFESDEEDFEIMPKVSNSATSKSRIFINKINVGGMTMYLVNWRNNAYLFAEDFRKNLTSVQSVHVLFKRGERLAISFLPLKNQAHPEFFKQISKLRIDFVLNNDPNTVVLIPLESAISFLKYLGSHNTAVEDDIKLTLKNFSPTTACWFTSAQ